MIDLRVLAHFLTACEHENLSLAARTLDIAPSTLSASLKSLETSVGFSLFRKQSGGVIPHASAHWLYDAAMSVLLWEAFSRRRVVAPADAAIGRLQIDIKLHFAFGSFRRALSHAIAAMAVAEPLVLIDPYWSTGGNDYFDQSGTADLDFNDEARVEIDTVWGDAHRGKGVVTLLETPWIVVRRSARPTETLPPPVFTSPQTFFVPRLPEALIDQITSWAEQSRHTLRFLDVPLRDWPRILDDHPSASLVLPASAIGTRLGVSRIDAALLSPPISSSIIGRSDGNPLSDRFLQHLKTSFDYKGSLAVHSPMLTARRIQYFNLVHDLRSVSAAARAANVAQPALSQQLRKLEESIGVSLFDRSTLGLARTPQSENFARVTAFLAQRLGEIKHGGHLAALTEDARLVFGVMPSVSQNGYLIEKVTEAVLELRKRHPRMRLTVREAPNTVLKNAVQRGDVGMAIVETVLPQMPRLALNTAEDLAVIADPRHGIVPDGPINLSDLAHVPLVLPTTLFGLRQIIDTATRRAGVELKILHEIDALSMLVALLARERIATILPPSALKAELIEGKFREHKIISPAINRSIFIIHSGRRPLTQIERDLVMLLREGLADRHSAAA